jgi:hypothetical protein
MTYRLGLDPCAEGEARGGMKSGTKARGEHHVLFTRSRELDEKAMEYRGVDRGAVTFVGTVILPQGERDRRTGAEYCRLRASICACLIDLL